MIFTDLEIVCLFYVVVFYCHFYFIAGFRLQIRDVCQAASRSHWRKRKVAHVRVSLSVRAERERDSRFRTLRAGDLGHPVWLMQSKVRVYELPGPSTPCTAEGGARRSNAPITNRAARDTAA